MQQTLSMSTIESIAVTAQLIDPDGASDPLQRWLEYKAYAELKEWLLSIDELPYDVIDEELPVGEITAWIKGDRPDNPFNFRARIEGILSRLKASGSDGINDLCRRYCQYKEKMALSADGSTAVLSFDAIREMILETVFDALIFSGVPVTVLISFLIRSGALDRLCDCNGKKVQARS